MDAIREYVVSAAAAAMLCGILRALVQEKGTMGTVLKLISGLFLAFTLISPLTEIELDDLAAISPSFLEEAEAASAEGEKIADKAAADIIKQRTEAYILDKARSLDAAVEIEITVGGEIPVPIGARISGTVNPYTKARLESILEKELGIARENQIWIG